VPSVTVTRSDSREGLARGLTFALLAASLACPVPSSPFILPLHVGLLVLFPVIAGSLARDPMLRRVCLAGALWSGAQLVSSYVNGTDLTAGIGTVGFLTATLVLGMVWVARSTKLSDASIVAALALGWILRYYTVLRHDPSMAEGLLANPWKYSISVPISLFVLAAAWRLRWKRVWVCALLVLISLVSIVKDFRFLAGLALAVAVIVLILGSSVSLGSRAKVHASVIGVSVLIALYLSYPSLATAGFFGERAHDQQAEYDQTDTNFLIANRAEMPQAAYLTAKHPFVGIGANAVLSSEEASEALDFVRGLGVAMTPARKAYLLDQGDTNQGYVTHSALLDSTLQAGLLALPFWWFSLAALLRNAARTRDADAGRVALVWFIGLLCVWNALFSPLGISLWLCVALGVFLARGPEVRHETDPLRVQGPAQEGTSASPGRTLTRSQN
jgi:hypothetical protein